MHQKPGRVVLSMDFAGRPSIDLANHLSTLVSNNIPTGALFRASESHPLAPTKLTGRQRGR